MKNVGVLSLGLMLLLGSIGCNGGSVSEAEVQAAKSNATAAAQAAAAGGAAAGAASTPEIPAPDRDRSGAPTAEERQPDLTVQEIGER